jgi:alpha-1,3/alpha-1,6-mannosyltransferase
MAPQSNGSGSKARIAFCHLDLGVGGAERFIVDSAREVQDAGHTVHVYTAHYDTNR